ncbi:hypothetical protein DFH11DRAFT_1731519 [Phellopilus nigrolimitatus]|nr:hypothetical protein DFH11DRAFT_1731519 [Phellopilus nigrolimitatus]
MLSPPHACHYPCSAPRVERGRSHTIPPQAIARKAREAEENRSQRRKRHRIQDPLPIPLNESHTARTGDAATASRARVFAPLAFLPPPPLGPRTKPATPKRRMRWVADPHTLRLQALANLLAERGVPWKERKQEHSLDGSGKRLKSVAVGGLGRSQLAFEVK